MYRIASPAPEQKSTQVWPRTASGGVATPCSRGATKLATKAGVAVPENLVQSCADHLHVHVLATGPVLGGRGGWCLRPDGFGTRTCITGRKHFGKQGRKQGRKQDASTTLPGRVHGTRTGRVQDAYITRGTRTGRIHNAQCHQAVRLSIQSGSTPGEVVEGVRDGAGAGSADAVA